MKPIYSYINYREYLSDYYAEQKQKTRYFSHRYFCQKAGIASSGFLNMVIDGKKNLSENTINKFVGAIGLKSKEALFFRNLVLFNQAKTAAKKQDHYSAILTMLNTVTAYNLQATQHRCFDLWYVMVVRELVCIHDFQDNFDLIAQSLYPPIKRSEAQEAVNMLLRLNLIEKNSDGHFVQTHTAIRSDGVLGAYALHNFHKAMIENAGNALETQTAKVRNISSLTVGISESTYEVLLTELKAFKDRVHTIVNNDKKSSQVYQINFQIFPISKNMNKDNNTDPAGDNS